MLALRVSDQDLSQALLFPRFNENGHLYMKVNNEAGVEKFDPSNQPFYLLKHLFSSTQLQSDRMALGQWGVVNFVLSE